MKFSSNRTLVSILFLALVAQLATYSSANASTLTLNELTSFSGYCGIDAFSEGLAVVSLCESGKKGVVDKEGKLVVSANFSNIGKFSEGLASAQGPEGGPGFIDKTGKWIISPNPLFSSVGAFHNSLASVCLGKPNQPCSSEGYINRSGKIVLQFSSPPSGVELSDGGSGSTVAYGYNPNEDLFGNDFSDNLNSFEFGVIRGYSFSKLKNLLRPGLNIGKVSKYIFRGHPEISSANSVASPVPMTLTVGSDGKIKIFGKYNYVAPFHQGLAWAFQRVGNKVKWSGFIDSAGNKKISLGPAEIPLNVFSNDVSTIADTSGDGRCAQGGSLFGLISRSGKWLIKPSFTYLGSFHEGLALASNSPCQENGPGYPSQPENIGATYFFVDQTGKRITEDISNLTMCYPFHNGIAVLDKDVGGSQVFSLIDREGHQVRSIESEAYQLLGENLISIYSHSGAGTRRVFSILGN